MDTAEVLLQGQKGELRTRVELHALPRRVAVRNGLMLWGGCWLAAILTLPIPLVHFIAPPLLLFLGPALGIGIYKLYKNAVEVTGRAACPDCGVPVALGPRSLRWPIELECPACQARLYGHIADTV